MSSAADTRSVSLASCLWWAASFLSVDALFEQCSAQLALGFDIAGLRAAQSGELSLGAHQLFGHGCGRGRGGCHFRLELLHVALLLTQLAANHAHGARCLPVGIHLALGGIERLELGLQVAHFAAGSAAALGQRAQRRGGPVDGRQHHLQAQFAPAHWSRS
ncbi:hypothetical protein GCM10007860_06430 [Chitiniphilus shinanonensis]|uniref:Uncharacterized protein n=1 Tax=Chitiniphilus shinanonensis TaxID=553088 RepID=A0ABQ6BPZ2_9NEIS|nr:hypothetical protein [Chitiniphilus shinanonensis]GLS03499.1 hypothetical protein GCM10007860_06430 [Chitiniphilus shinanonensis]